MKLLKNPLSFQTNLDRFIPATEDEKTATNMMRPNTTFFKDGIKRFFKNPVAATAFVIILLITIAAFVIPMIYPYKYDEIICFRYTERLQSSFTKLKPFEYAQLELDAIENGIKVFPHILGTDVQGHDFFIRVVVGTRTSLLVGVFAALIVLAIGGLIGSLSGYIGGKFDLIVMRIVDVIYSLPDVLIVILLSTILKTILGDLPPTSILYKLGSGYISIFIVFALLYWVSMARLVRGQILVLKKSEYIMAAKASGASTGRIIKKHLLPNSISVIIISAALQIPNAIFTEAFLSYLGLGIEYPQSSLGSLANEAKNMLSIGINLHLFFAPAIIICLIVLSLNLVGDGLRDAFDPKNQR